MIRILQTEKAQWDVVQQVPFRLLKLIDQGFEDTSVSDGCYITVAFRTFESSLLLGPNGHPVEETSESLIETGRFDNSVEAFRHLIYTSYPLTMLEEEDFPLDEILDDETFSDEYPQFFELLDLRLINFAVACAQMYRFISSDDEARDSHYLKDYANQWPGSDFVLGWSIEPPQHDAAFALLCIDG